jgi:hypothetical protein
MNIRVLAFEGCPNDQPTIALIEEVLRELGIEAEVNRVEVSEENAERLRFLGSPTVQIDGVDIEPAARERTGFGMSCRTYSGGKGVPSRELLEAAITKYRPDMEA